MPSVRQLPLILSGRKGCRYLCVKDLQERKRSFRRIHPSLRFQQQMIPKEQCYVLENWPAHILMWPSRCDSTTYHGPQPAAIRTNVTPSAQSTARTRKQSDRADNKTPMQRSGLKSPRIWPIIAGYSSKKGMATSTGPANARYHQRPTKHRALDTIKTKKTDFSLQNSRLLWGKLPWWVLIQSK